MSPPPTRRYQSFRAFLREGAYLIRRLGQVRRLMNGRDLDPAFRERLMLAVTEVNQCRFCSYAHTKAALKAGLSAEEIGQLLSGQDDAAPEAERIALLFAQHWAETEGDVDPEAEVRLRQAYPETTVRALFLALRIIRFGNYSVRSLEHAWNTVRPGRKADVI